MKRELDEALVKDFPNLYSDRHGDLRTTAMCWGFECGSGWEPLLRELSEGLEKEILKLPVEHRQYCRASQVKEKYATLRFYMSSQTDEMDYLIGEAEHKSAITCEECGKPGKCRGDGWYYTACDDCNIKRYLRDCVGGIVRNVKQVEKEDYKGEKYLDNVIENKEENIEGMLQDLKELFNPIKEKKTTKEKLQNLWSDIDWFFYRVKSNVIHPLWFLQDIKCSIKHKIWKLKRALSRLCPRKD